MALRNIDWHHLPDRAGLAGQLRTTDPAPASRPQAWHPPTPRASAEEDPSLTP